MKTVNIVASYSMTVMRPSSINNLAILTKGMTIMWLSTSQVKFLHVFGIYNASKTASKVVKGEIDLECLIEKEQLLFKL